MWMRRCESRWLWNEHNSPRRSNKAEGDRTQCRPIQSRLLELLEKLTARAGNVNPAGDAALAVFHALDNARGFAALGAIRARCGVHDLLAVGCFCDFGTYCHR